MFLISLVQTDWSRFSYLPPLGLEQLISSAQLTIGYEKWKGGCPPLLTRVSVGILFPL